MERTLVAFTTSLICVGVAHATRLQPPLPDPPPTSDRRIVAVPHAGLGRTLARQAIAPDATADIPRGQRAQSRVIYLNRDGAQLWPGVNDSYLETSSVVAEPTAITPWDIDDELWVDTVACVRELFARFDVVVTDVDPGDVPHIEAVFGGHPADVGLPDDVAGISPFTTDCSVIERSVVFTFTDVLPDDARVMCEVMAQEIAHSYGLDHQVLPSDPMTYLDYDGDREFQTEASACGEYEPRPCGIGGTVCRETQSSLALLTERLGPRTAPAGNIDRGDTTPEDDVAGGGCSAGGDPGGLALVILGALSMRVCCRGRQRFRQRFRPIVSPSHPRHSGRAMRRACSCWSSRTRSTSRRRSSTTCAPRGSRSGSLTAAARASPARRRIHFRI